MATIDTRKNKAGEITGYRFRACVGRDEQYKQVWRTVTIPRPEGLTPAKERKEVQRLADEWEQSQKAEYDKSHAKTDKDRITLADFIAGHWWEDHVESGEHTPSTISFYQHMSTDILSYFGDKKRLRQIDTEAVKKYLKYLRTDARTKKGEPYSQSTIQHHFNVLRIVLRYAVRMGYIPSDPTQNLTPQEKPHKEKKKVDFLTPEEAREFIRCLEAEPLFWRAFVNVLITCGLRRGECIGLQWRDIDTKGMTLTVERNVTADPNSSEKIRVGPTKTGEARVVPLSPRVLGLLMELRRQQEEKLQLTLLPSCFIFSRQADPRRPLYPTEPTRFMRKFIARHNLPNMSPHDLRHTAATLALESGADLKQVQQLLGHQDPSTTMAFYTGLTEERQRQTVEGIERLLG